MVGVVVLIISLVKGCNNQKQLSKINIDYNGRIKSLMADSVERVKELAAYRDTMQFLDGQLSLSDNKLLFLNEDLGRANDRIGTLLKKHVPILPSLDTNITTVGNDFIEECADCFKELGNGQKLVLKYKAEKDNQEQIFKGLVNVKDNRIRNLEKSNSQLLKNYTSLIDSSKRFQNNSMPRGRLYLSWGVLWKSYVPWAAGAGLMYQTRRSVIFGASWYYNSHGHMVQTNIHFPLSLRRLK